MQQRIKNSPKEREKEYSHFWVGKIWSGWKRENQIFIVVGSRFVTQVQKSWDMSPIQ